MDTPEQGGAPNFETIEMDGMVHDGILFVLGPESTLCVRPGLSAEALAIIQAQAVVWLSAHRPIWPIEGIVLYADLQGIHAIITGYFQE